MTQVNEYRLFARYVFLAEAMLAFVVGLYLGLLWELI